MQSPELTLSIKLLIERGHISVPVEINGRVHEGLIVIPLRDLLDGRVAEAKHARRAEQTQA